MVKDSSPGNPPNISARESLLQYVSEKVRHFQDLFGLSVGKAFMLWYGVEAIGLTEDTAY